MTPNPTDTVQPSASDSQATCPACEVKDRVIADCERMLRFAPPPKHLAESNQWQQAIRDAQDELQMGRPGQLSVPGRIERLERELTTLRERAEKAEACNAEANRRLSEALGQRDAATQAYNSQWQKREAAESALTAAQSERDMHERAMNILREVLGIKELPDRPGLWDEICATGVYEGRDCFFDDCWRYKAAGLGHGDGLACQRGMWRRVDEKSVADQAQADAAEKLVEAVQKMKAQGSWELFHAVWLAEVVPALATMEEFEAAQREAFKRLRASPPVSPAAPFIVSGPDAPQIAAPTAPCTLTPETAAKGSG